MHRFKRKLFTISFFVLIVLAHHMSAQVRLLHIPAPNSDVRYSKATDHKKNAGKRIMAKSMKLPFFDDFSIRYDSVWVQDSVCIKDSLIKVVKIVNGIPTKKDTTICLKYSFWTKGGTRLNNSEAIDQPSINVVTFDGLNRKGLPYDFENALHSSAADTLTTQPIDLSGLNAGSNVYLSFAWQAGGLGELPDITNTQMDSLALFFRKNDGTWRRAWSKRSPQSVKPFKNEVIPIIDPAYFYSNFQFRFISYGNLSGAFDAWHIDYIRLNSGRNPADTIDVDLALTKAPTSLLRRYQSMPYSQFKKNPQFETADHVDAFVYNLNNTFKIITPTLKLINSLNNNLIASIGSTPSDRLIVKFTKESLYFKIDYNNLLTSADALYLKLRFNLSTNEETSTTEPHYYARNDTTTLTTVLNNYYAYDDGTPERAMVVEGRGSQLACKYYLNEQDTLTAIDIYFIPEIADITGKNFRLMIWKSLNDKPRSIGTVARYGDEKNGFFRYQFGPEYFTILRDSFYIGFEQPSLDLLPVGFDRNTNSNQNIYYRIGGDVEWTQFTKYQGSVMIRPVFQSIKDNVLGNDKAVEAKPYKLFPNPATGLVNVEGNIESVSVFDPVGRRILDKSFKNNVFNQLELSNLNPGLYLVHLRRGKNVYVEKLLLQN